MSFYTSLNGLKNAQTELSVIANNLANAETEASRVFRRLLSVRRSYHEQDKEQVFT